MLVSKETVTKPYCLACVASAAVTQVSVTAALICSWRLVKAGTQFVTRSSLFSSPLFSRPTLLCKYETQGRQNRKSDDRVTNWASVAQRRTTGRFQHTQVLRSGDCWRGSKSYHCSHTVKTTDRRRSAPLAAAYVYVRVGASLIGSVVEHHCRRVGLSGEVSI